MNEVKNNSPKRPVIFYYAIALVVLLALNFLLVPWMSERSVKRPDITSSKPGQCR